jgi:hypothetical protein
MVDAREGTTMNTLGIAAAAAGLLLLFKGQSSAAGPTVTLPNGTRVGPGGLVYNAQGQVLGRTTPQQYARAVAAHGRATGQTAVQTLGLIKSIVGLGTDLYKTIAAVLKADATQGGAGAGDAQSTAEVLRDRIAVDPTAAATDNAASTNDLNAIYDEANAWTFEAPVPVPDVIHIDVVGIDAYGNVVATDGTPLTPLFGDDGAFAGFVDTFGTPVDVGSIVVDVGEPISVPSVADIVTGG